MILALVNKQFYSKVRSHSNQYLSKLIMSDSRFKYQYNAIESSSHDEDFNLVSQLVDHISMWLLFIFRCMCSELRTILPWTSRQPSDLAARSDLTRLTFLQSFVPMHPWRTPNRCCDGATLGRTLTTWYFEWEITLIKSDYRAIKKGAS